MSKKSEAKEEGEQKPGDNISLSARRLHSFIERVERLEGEKKDLAGDIREVYGEAKSTGFDTKVMRDIVKRRAKGKADIEEYDALLATYETAIDSILD
jgi:uncharacterized protein (UPF0335 family)